MVLRQVPPLKDARGPVAARRPAAVVVLAALGCVLLDLLRAEVGDAVRPWQYAAALGLLALTALLLRRLRVPWAEARPYLALGVLLVPAAVDHAREVRSDGVHYYAFLRSALFDRDLDTANDYPLLGSDFRGPDPLPIGAPLLWSPFVSLVHLGREGARALGLAAPSGVEPVYAAAVCLASFAYGAAGLLLLLRILGRTGLSKAAFWAVVVAWVGSPLRFYLSVIPSFAHACEFFAAVLVLAAVLDLRDRPSGGGALRAGLACGLLFLVRSQDGLLLLVPALLVVGGARRGQDPREILGRLVRLGAGFALAALPQLLVWQVQYGFPFVVPHARLHGAAFFRSTPELWGTLFSPRGGLFVAYPALLGAFLGFLLLALRPLPTREPRAAGVRGPFDAPYVACLLPVFLLGFWLNASVFDWYQVRRYTGLVPFLAPGLLILLVPLARAGTPWLALAAFLAWRYDDAVDARRNNPGDPVPVRLVVGTLADRLAADAYALVEPLAPRTAVALLASYTGEALLEEDVSYLDLGRSPALLGLPRPAVFLGEAEVEDGRAARWVTARYTRLALPLSWRGPLLVRLQARALETLEPQILALEWNGFPCGERPMSPDWREYAFDVPAPAVRRGTNALVLRFARGPLYFRVRGQGPREVRPAALSWLTLNRAGPEER